MILIALATMACNQPGPAPREAGTPPPTAAPPAAGPPAIFTDITEASGVRFLHDSDAHGQYRLPEEMGPGGAFFDADGDGDMDLYLLQGGPLQGGDPRFRAQLYRNDGAGRFTDVSAGSGADILGVAMGCAAADLDADGDVDLYVTRLGPNVLLLNRGDGTFEDATEASGVGDPGFGTSAAFFDYDRDGHLDLLSLNYADWSASRELTCFGATGARDYCNPKDYDRPSPARLYRGLGKGRFEDVSERSGIAKGRGNGLGLLVSDFTGDGWLDVYVANDQTPAFLWINRQDGTFSEDAGLRGCAFSGDGMLIAGMGTAAEDLDGDGDFDIVVTNIHGQAHLALRNDGGRFRDVSHAWGFAGWAIPYTGFGIALFDQDLDGRLDGYVANGAVNQLVERFDPADAYAEPDQFIRSDADGRFRDATAETGKALLPHRVSRGVLVADIDDDGDLDLLVTHNHSTPRLLRNEEHSGRAWTLLDLLPARGGRQALNAVVTVHASGRTQVRECRPHAGYLGTNDPRIHFGLDQAEVIERLVVKWPGGSEETWTGLPVKQRLQLREGLAPAFTALGQAGGGTP